MTTQQKAEALAANPKYSKVSLPEHRRLLSYSAAEQSFVAFSTNSDFPPYHPSWCVQIRDLNAGTFGFVELALDKSTGQQVAIKFIERGDKVCKCGCCVTMTAASYQLLCLYDLVVCTLGQKPSRPTPG